MSVRVSRGKAFDPGSRVTVSGVSITVAPSRPGRDTLALTNADTSGWIYLNIGPEAAVIGSGVPLGPGGGALVLEGYTGPVTGISDDVFGTYLSKTEL